jgi:hypothetical protein
MENVQNTEHAEVSEKTISPDINQSNQKPVGDHLSFIARMEKKIRQREEALEKQRKEMDEKYNKYSKWEEYEKKLEVDPLEVLKEKGWDYEKLTNHAMSKISDEDLDPVQRELKDLRGFKESVPQLIQQAIQEAVDKENKKYEVQSYEQEIKNIKQTISATVSSNKDKYELINEHGDEALDLVFETIKKHVEQQQANGVAENEIKMLSYTEAADKVEEYLDNELQRYLRLNKVKNKFGHNHGDPNKSPFNKTISDDFAPRTAPVSESEEDRVKKAIELVRSGLLSGG